MELFDRRPVSDREVVVVLSNPQYNGPEYRTYRLSSFIGTSLSGFAPIIHGAILFDLDTFTNSGIPYYLLEGLLLIIAVYITSTK
ncbi:hypothetical protein EMCG_08067 [[Emmonsia] crescens]|uniref:Uncharacterized protein n=1 Tax=[Emmonsia] crescens TaxID=73230 RepID=A0A0G2JAR3_9EURO|nr:hypothetical protein EMCG_08067 [Emmonsia crescens UAMH 3008]